MPAVFSRETNGAGMFQQHFPGERRTTVQDKVIAVCVPMYNEKAVELEKTLQSLYAMSLYMDGKYTLKICIILDGWSKVSDCAEAWLREKFPENSWHEQVCKAVEKDEKLTVILHEDRCKVGTDDGSDQLMDLTVLLKTDNRKKHNSHDLFFRGFADHLNVKYVFATDCGTLFEPKCLHKLVTLMDQDENCIACTGRQRVMSRLVQPGCQNEGTLERMLRTVQGYDYEASTVVFNSCFSLFGVLAVVPGPCGLFRLRPLLDPVDAEKGQASSPFAYYMKAAAEAEEKQEFLKGNAVLAEDRILTYAALHLTGEKKYTVRWQKDAIFLFQSEQKLETLVKQRRRWLNGTIASYIYVLNELNGRVKPLTWRPSLICTYLRRPCLIYTYLKTNFHTRFAQSLILLMLIIHLGIALAPFIYIYGGLASLQYLMTGPASATDIQLQEPLYMILAGVLFGVFVLFSIGHHREEWDQRLFVLAGFCNAFLAGVMLVAMTMLFYYEWEKNSWIKWLTVFYVLLPILLNALVPDYTALKTLMNPANFLIYMLWMPTVQGFFLTYAIARTFDLSWGNRAASNKLSEKEQEQEKKKEKKRKRESQALMLLQALLNLVLLVLAFSGSSVTKPLNHCLMVFLLVPTALISFFSAQQALGFWYFWGAAGVIMILWSAIIFEEFSSVVHDKLLVSENVLVFLRGNQPMFVVIAVASVFVVKALYKLCRTTKEVVFQEKKTPELAQTYQGNSSKGEAETAEVFQVLDKEVEVTEGATLFSSEVYWRVGDRVHVWDADSETWSTKCSVVDMVVDRDETVDGRSIPSGAVRIADGRKKTWIPKGQQKQLSSAPPFQTEIYFGEGDRVNVFCSDGKPWYNNCVVDKVLETDAFIDGVTRPGGAVRVNIGGGKKKWIYREYLKEHLEFSDSPGILPDIIKPLPRTPDQASAIHKDQMNDDTSHEESSPDAFSSILPVIDRMNLATSSLITSSSSSSRRSSTTSDYRRSSTMPDLPKELDIVPRKIEFERISKSKGLSVDASEAPQDREDVEPQAYGKPVGGEDCMA